MSLRNQRLSGDAPALIVINRETLRFQIRNHAVQHGDLRLFAMQCYEILILQFIAEYDDPVTLALNEEIDSIQRLTPRD